MFADKICFKWNKNCYQRKKKLFVNENRVQITALNFSCRFSGLCVAFCELAWSCMTFLWSYMAFYGILWQNIDSIGFV